MQKLSTSTLIGIVISLLLFGILFPIGLKGLIDPNNWMYNSTTSIWNVAENGDTLKTLVLTLLPVLVITGIVMYFIPRNRD